MGSGRGVHGKENPRKFYAVGLRAESALSPRQLPTDHDYAVSTREYQSDQPSRKLPRPRLTLPPKSKKKKGTQQLFVVDRSFHIRTYQDLASRFANCATILLLVCHIGLKRTCQTKSGSKRLRTAEK